MEIFLYIKLVVCCFGWYYYIAKSKETGSRQKMERRLHTGFGIEYLKKSRYALLAALITAFLFTVIYTMAGRMIGGNTLFMRSDLIQQYSAFNKLFFRNLLEGGSLDYSFQISLGMPTAPLYAFYCLSPFNLAFYLIDNVDAASAVVVILKLSVAAFTFQKFAVRVLKRDGLPSLVCAVAYALCSYCVFFCYNIHTLDGVYMLPVLVTLIVGLVKHGRFLALTLAYAYIFIVNFYCGYILGFFSLLIFLLMMLFEYKKDVKRYVSCGAKFLTAVLLAAMAGAFVLLPMAREALTNMSETIPPHLGWLLLSPVELYSDFFIGVIPDQQFKPFVYGGIILMYLAPCFFADRSIALKSKISAAVLLVFLGVCSFFKPAYLFMHCFNFPNGCGYRFAYFYAFVLLSMGCLEWEHMEKKSTWKLLIVCVGNIIFYGAAYAWQERYSEAGDVIFSIMGWGVNAAFFTAYFWLFAFAMKKKSWKQVADKLLFLLVLAELTVNGYLCVDAIWTGVRDERAVYEAFLQLSGSAVDEIKAQDNGVYRISYVNAYNWNDAALNDYMGFDYYSTVENPVLRNALSHLGYFTVERAAHDYGGTSMTKMLFAEKYDININKAEYYTQSGVIPSWEWNEETLSLGFMASERIMNTALDSESAFDNQNRLISDLTGKDLALFTPYEGTIEFIPDNMTIEYWEESGYRIAKADEAMDRAVLTVRLPEAEEKPVYAYFAQKTSILFLGLSSPYTMSEGGDIGTILAPSFLSVPHLSRMGRNESGVYALDIIMSENTFHEFGYKNMYFAYYNDAVVSEAYQELKDHQLQIMEVDGDRIYGEITVENDKTVLFTSIPYDEGWHILVDGKEQETIAVVDGAFLAAELMAGRHEITLYYQDDIITAGCLISAAAAVIYLMVCIIVCQRRKGSIAEIVNHEAGEN